jgi:hypothetical protein
MFPFKLLVSSDNANKHLHDIENSSFQRSLYENVLVSPINEQQIVPLINDVTRNEHSIVDKYQLTSFQHVNECIASSHDNNHYINASIIPLKKKVTRINHYPNMLADFD